MINESLELSLKHFCELANFSISQSNDKVSEFMRLRYDVMSKQFPHDVFSVEQATLDFFEKTLDILNGSVTVTKEEENKSKYTKNYYEWCRKNCFK